jgi:hypothetical protein
MIFLLILRPVEASLLRMGFRKNEVQFSAFSEWHPRAKAGQSRSRANTRETADISTSRDLDESITVPVIPISPSGVLSKPV